jgi:cytoskeletal protein CcmA (bactofilin family)
VTRLTEIPGRAVKFRVLEKEVDLMALKDLMGRTPEPARPQPPLQPQTQAPPVAAPRPAPAPPVQVAHLGASCVLTGELRSTDSLRIDGKVKGQVFCDQTLTIGESGVVHAAIDGDTIVIAGEVKGDITARHKITLERTARVTGDLSTPGIVIQEGATLEGRIAINGGPQEKQASPPARAANAS